MVAASMCYICSIVEAKVMYSAAAFFLLRIWYAAKYKSYVFYSWFCVLWYPINYSGVLKNWLLLLEIYWQSLSFLPQMKRGPNTPPMQIQIYLWTILYKLTDISSKIQNSFCHCHRSKIQTIRTKMSLTKQPKGHVPPASKRLLEYLLCLSWTNTDILFAKRGGLRINKCNGYAISTMNSVLSVYNWVNRQ